MFFSLKAIVPGASPELVEEVRRRSRLVQLMRNGSLVVLLHKNREASHANYAREWQVVDPGEARIPRYYADFSGGTVHEVYDVPRQLVGTDYRLLFEAIEAHSPGSYCQVITSYNGGRLRPYRREREHDEVGFYLHPTTSAFSVPRLGVLRLDTNAARQQGRLIIRRATVEIVDDLVVVTNEQLFCHNDPSLAVAKFGDLPPGLAAWRPALQALFERWGCEADFCNGHYHSDRR